MSGADHGAASHWWVRRLAVAAVAAVGLATAVYLTLVQLEVVHAVWDPVSSGGSEWILRRSPLVRWLGFPDASFGIVAYAADLVLDVPGGDDRARTNPRLVLAAGAVAGAMAAGSLVLTALQVVYGHLCSLCLVSAAASLVIAGLVAGEVRTAAGVLADPGDGPSTNRPHRRPPAGDRRPSSVRS